MNTQIVRYKASVGFLFTFANNFHYGNGALSGYFVSYYLDCSYKPRVIWILYPIGLGLKCYPAAGTPLVETMGFKCVRI